MSTIAPIANLTWDNADANGRIDLHGAGFDWTFPPVRQEGGLDPNNWQPVWYLNNCEIVPGLNLLGLRGDAVLDDMSLTALSGWTTIPSTGHWRREMPDSFPRKYWLSYMMDNVNEAGYATSKLHHYPKIAVSTIEFAPPPGQTSEVFTTVELLGSEVSYRLEIPVYSATYKYPLLLVGEKAAEDEAPTTWTQLDTFERVDLDTAARTPGIIRRVILIEEVDGALVIRLSGASEPWVFIPLDGPDDDPGHWAPQYGPVRVRFEGHSGMFNMQPITYSGTGIAYPVTFIRMDPDIHPTPYSVVSEADDSHGTVAVTFDQSGADVRPRITLTGSEDTTLRPLVHAVHQYHNATLSAARSTPLSMAARSATLKAAGADPTELQSLTWTRRLYRDWEFSATIRDPYGYWADVLKPNMKCTVQAGFDALSNIMVGYIDRPVMALDPAENQGLSGLFTVHGKDYVMARLADKKLWGSGCTPEGWDLATWAQWLLTRAGVGVTFTGDAGVTVTTSRRKDLQFDYSPGDPLLQCLDEVFAAHNWTPLSVNSSGNLLAGVEAAYSGTPDFTLDDDTATGDDVIFELDAQHDSSDFRNAAFVFYQDVFGVNDMDKPSYQTPTDKNFIGDDWWVGEENPDLPWPELRAYQLRKKHAKSIRRISWRRLLYPALIPGMYVLVNVEGVGVPAGTVFKIITETGTTDLNTLEGYSTFEGEVEQWGA